MKSLSRIIAEGRGDYITPRSVQDAIPIRRIYEDGMILTGNYFTKTIRFSDINYSNASDNDKERMFISLAQLINSFPDLTYTKITIFNRPVGRTDQEKKIEIPDRSDSLKPYRDELQAYLFTNVTVDSIVQDKYITIGVNEKDKETARSYLAKQTASIRTGLDAISSEMEEVGIFDRLKIFHDFYNPYSTNPFTFDFDDTLKKGHSFKDHIAPDSFSFKANYFMAGEMYGRVLVMRTFGSTVKDEMVSFITKRNKVMMFSADYYPIPTAQAKKLVDQKLLGAETNKTRWQRRQNDNSNFSAEPPFEMQLQIDELKEMLDDLMNRDQKMIMTTITLVHLASSRDELDADTEEIKNAANRYGCSFGTLTYQQYDGLNTVLPFGGKINIMAQRTFTTECACCVTMPFSARVLQQEGGVFIGKNPVNRSPILINRRLLRNGNAFYLGSPGGGKSFKAKEVASLLLMQNDDVDIIFVDPDNEYTHLVEAFNGSVYSFSPDANTYSNPLEINEYYNTDEEGNAASPLQLKSELIISLFEAIMGSGSKVSAKDRSIIDRCLRNILQPYIDNGYRGDCPVLGDLRNELLRQEEAEARELATALEIFTEGSLKLFNHQSNVDLSSKRVCSFEYSRIGSSLKGVGTLFALDAIQNKITSNMQKNRITFVVYDEVSYIYQHDMAGGFLETQFRRARKYGAQLTGMTQNVTDVLKSETAATMLQNSDLVIIFGQDGKDLEEIRKLLKLSDDEEKFILNARVGEGIVKVGRSFIPFEDDFPKDTQMYMLMTTKPGERLVD